MNQLIPEIKFLKTAEEIEENRERILSRFKNLKQSTHAKSKLLVAYKVFRLFEEEVDEFTSLLDDLLDAVPKEDLEDLQDVQAKICKHEDIEAEFSAREFEMIILEQRGLQMIRENHMESSNIREKICDMKKKWEMLRSNLTDQIEVLRTKQHYTEYVRNYDKLVGWINKKLEFLRVEMFFTHLEGIEQYIHDFHQLERKVFRMESEVEEIRRSADFFIKDDYPHSYHVSQKKEKLNESWTSLKEILSIKMIQLLEFIRIHKLSCRVKEFLKWIDEKYNFFSNNDFGTNLAELVIVQKKHNGMERIVEKLEARLDDIIEEHDFLRPVHSLYTDGILVGKREIIQKWLNLKIKAKRRGSTLRVHYRLRKYFDDVDDLVEWMNEIYTIISNEGISKEEDDAEVSLMIIKIYKDVIDSRKKSMKEIVRVGNEFAMVFNEKEEEIGYILSELDTAEHDINGLIEFQQNKYQLKLDLQRIHSKYDVLDNWLAQKEAFLFLDEDLLNCVDTVQELIEKHKEFEITFDNEKKRITSLVDEESNTEVSCSAQPDEIVERREQIGSRYKSIRIKSKKRLKLLIDALRMHMFYADCDAIDGWISEKLRIVKNGDHSDVSTISGSIASNNLFVNDLTDYTKIIYSLVAKEQKLIKEKHFATGVIQKRVEGILDSWVFLNHRTLEKISELEDLHDARTFLLASTRLEYDLSEYKDRLDHQYVFHDGEISNILKVELNLETLEREVRVSYKQIQTIKLTGSYLIKKGHTHAKIMKMKIKSLLKEHRTLSDIIEKKQQDLKDARKISELFMDIEEQMKWMKQKQSSLSFINTELGLLDVQYLISKHKTNKVEINVREKEVRALCSTGEQMIVNNHYDSDEIRTKLATFRDAWNQLKDKYEQFKLKLEEAKRIYEYYGEAELNEAILNENKTILSSTEYGINEDSSAALLKRHEVIVDDLKAFGRKIEDLRKRADNCRQKMPLSVSAVYQREPVLAVRDYTARKPSELTIMKGDSLRLVNSTNENWWKVEKSGRQGFVPKKCISNIESEEQQSVCPVLIRQIELEKLYDDLMNLTEVRRNNLANTHAAFSLVREASEMTSWIRVKEAYALEDDIGENMVQVEILQKKFDDFKSDLTEKKIKLIGVLTKTEKLHPFLRGELAQTLLKKTENMKSKMVQLQELTKKRDIQLSSAHELQRFYRDLDEAEVWMQEKTEKLDDADCGDSLKTIRTLLRKHEGLERDLDALDDRMEQLNNTASRLIRKYPESTNEIISKQKDINEAWSQLSQKAICRKQALLDSYDLQKFFADYNHLISWIDRMTVLMSSEEGTNDLHSAEILITNFEGTVSEMEKYEINIKTVQKFGEMLIGSNQSVSNDIQNKLEKLRQACELLERKKNNRKIIVDQNLQMNTFLRRCEYLEYWLTDKEVLLNTSGDNEQLIKMHKKLEQSLRQKEKEFRDLEQASRLLISFCCDGLERVSNKAMEVLSRWQELKEAHSRKRLQLKETQTLQQFSLEADEIEYWIDEKLLQATRENYRDPVNIKSKLLKHKAFEAEIESNAGSVETVLDHGNALMKNEESEKLKEAIQKRLEDISRQWEYLEEKTREKSEKLKEVSKQYDHIMGIKYMNFWMGDVETLLINQDIGKGLNDVKNLLGQHKVIEEDIEAHWKEIEDLEKEAEMFTNDSIFDIVSIQEEHENMISRYRRIEDLASQRKARLNDKNTAAQLFEAIADTEAWMRETALRIDDKNQPKFKCDECHPTYRFRK